MAYTQQIRILEQKLEQLRNRKLDTDNMVQTWAIEAEIRKLKRLEFEETYERVKFDDER